jgi:hypothetical protein
MTTPFPGVVWDYTEFQTIEGAWRNGTCGPAGVGFAESYGEQRYVSLAEVYGRMRKAGRCDASGVSSSRSCAAQLRADGFQITETGYHEPFAEAAWLPFLRAAAAAACPVHLETSYGQALRDAITGLGPRATNLRYHFITLFEYHDGGMHPRFGRNLPPGWTASDGASGAVRFLSVPNHTLVFYPLDVIRATRPCAFIRVTPKVRLGMGVPAGWSDDGATLVAPNGQPVVRGFRHYILTHYWPAVNVPVGPEYSNSSIEPGNPSIGAGARIDFLGAGDDKTDGVVSLGYTVSRNVYRIWVGQDIQAYGRLLAEARAQVGQLQAQLASAGNAALKLAQIKAIANQA